MGSPAIRFVDRKFEQLMFPFVQFTAFYKVIAIGGNAAAKTSSFYQLAQSGLGADGVNRLGYQTRSGKPWHHGTIRGIVCNLTYTGVLRSGESRAFIWVKICRTSLSMMLSRRWAVYPVWPLQITCLYFLTLYEEGQAVMASLSARYDDIISWAEMYDAASLEVKKMIVSIQEVMGSIPTVSTKQKALVISTGAFCCVFSLCNGLYKLCPRTELLIVDVKLYMDFVTPVMEMLKAEILKSLRGESSFPKDILSMMVSEAEKKCSLLQEQLETAQTLYEEREAVFSFPPFFPDIGHEGYLPLGPPSYG